MKAGMLHHPDDDIATHICPSCGFLAGPGFMGKLTQERADAIHKSWLDTQAYRSNEGPQRIAAAPKKPQLPQEQPAKQGSLGKFMVKQ